MWENIERFRRSSYSVYRLPKHCKLMSWMKRGYEICGIDYVWCEFQDNMLDDTSKSENESAVEVDDGGPASASSELHERGLKGQKQWPSRLDSLRRDIESTPMAGVRVPPGFERHRLANGPTTLAEEEQETVRKDSEPAIG